MNQPEINCDSSFPYNTYACAPPSANESVFFNLILNTKYENTKENCLIFLKNYSKNMAIIKRDLFKNMINELTLNPISNKIIGNDNDESLYLIRTCIKKYSRSNIINALFDFISQNENINNNIININSSSDITNANSFIDKIENVEFNGENEKEKIVNKNIDEEIDNIKNSKKNINLLKRKRKNNSEHSIFNVRKIRFSSVSKERKKDEEVNNKNGININCNNIKKEKINDENDRDNMNIKKEKDDFFERSFGFEEKQEHKHRMHLRNKSFSNQINPKKHAEQSNSNQDGKINSFSKGKRGRKKNNDINKENKENKEKIVFLCNNPECKGKGIYFLDKNVFEETEKHDFKKCVHVIGHKNKSIKDKFVKDKNCNGYQIMKDDKFIRDKDVLYLN